MDKSNSLRYSAGYLRGFQSTGSMGLRSVRTDDCSRCEFGRPLSAPKCIHNGMLTTRETLQ